CNLAHVRQKCSSCSPNACRCHQVFRVLSAATLERADSRRCTPDGRCCSFSTQRDMRNACRVSKDSRQLMIPRCDVHFTRTLYEVTLGWLLASHCCPHADDSSSVVPTSLRIRNGASGGSLARCLGEYRTRA